MNDRTSTSPSHGSRAGWSVGALIVVWLGVITAGWCGFARYEFSINKPSAQGRVAEWPQNSALERMQGVPTLVLFLHPKCPCSRATLYELNRTLAIAAETGSVVPQLLVVATVPPKADADWMATDTLREAREIDRAQIYVDRGGVEAARFGATTSGLMMYFDSMGRCQFAGGITISRGHEGPSAGGNRLVELIRGEATETNAVRDLPVFGCRLCLPTSTDTHEIVDNSRAKLTPPKSSI